MMPLSRKKSMSRSSVERLPLEQTLFITSERLAEDQMSVMQNYEISMKPLADPFSHSCKLTRFEGLPWPN